MTEEQRRKEHDAAYGASDELLLKGQKLAQAYRDICQDDFEEFVKTFALAISEIACKDNALAMHKSQIFGEVFGSVIGTTCENWQGVKIIKEQGL